MTAWPTVRWSSADQIIATIDPEEDAPPPPPESAVEPAEWYRRLTDAGETMDAVSFIAHALPRYEAVMWAARTLLDTQMLDRTSELVRAIMRWIDDPQDGNRRRVRELVDTVPNSRIEHALGLAVFMSGGSLNPPGMPAALPRPDLTAKFAFLAVVRGARKGDQRVVMHRAIQLGQEIAAAGQAR